MEEIKKKRKVKSLKEQYEDTIKKLEKIKNDIEKQNRKKVLNFFIDIAEDKELLEFISLNSKNKDIQNEVFTIIKQKFLGIETPISEDKEEVNG